VTEGLLQPAPLDGQMRVLVDGLDHPEGVAYDPAADILWAGGEDGQLYRLAVDGSGMETFGDPGAGITLGIAVDGAGRPVVCSPGRGALLVLDDGRLRPVLDRFDGTPLTLPNFASFGPDGALYLTDSGSWGRNDGRLLRLDPSGQAERLCPGLERFPNGLAVSADGRTLWCVESFAPALSRIDLRGDGRPEVVLRLDGTVPDGLALTTEGGLLISLYRPDRILHLDARGRMEVLADDPQGTLLSAPTNVCFAGPELELLVSANLGRWHLTGIETRLRGLAPHRPAHWAADR
jgi:gluconolactonase